MSFVFVIGNILSGCLGRILHIPLPLAFYTIFFYKKIMTIKEKYFENVFKRLDPM